MNSLDLEQQNIEQRKRMAEMLRMQNQQPQGQMVGNHFVAPSPLASLLPAVNQLAGAYAGRKADEEMTALGQKRNKSLVEGLRNYAQLAKGTPAETMQPLTPNDDEGNAMPVAQRDAVAGNPQAAAESLLSNENPQLQQLGMQQLIAGLVPKQAKWEKVEMPNPDGSVRTGFVDVNSPRPFETFQAGGTKPVAKKLAPSGQFYNEFTAQEGGALVDPNKPFNIGPNGQPTANTAFQAYETQKARAGAANTSVNVNTAPKAFLGEIGKGVGEAFNNDYAGAQSAVGTLNNVQQIRSGLSKAIVGPTATARVKVAQIGELLGVGGKDNAEKLANTRAVMQGLARQEMVAAQGMKGQGQITESERAILRKAESGNIEEFTVPEINSLLGALERTANARIQRHQGNLERLSKDPNAAGVVDYMRIEPPPSAPQQQAPAAGGFRIIGVK